jgi:hypothetical protein
MLNKELLMMGGAEELWTLRFKFTGDSYIDLILQDSNGQTLWTGHPSTDIVTVRVPPKSILILSGIVGVVDTIKADGCRVEEGRHVVNITLLQSDAYLELLIVA